jgi:hypothetical protein
MKARLGGPYEFAQTEDDPQLFWSDLVEGPPEKNDSDESQEDSLHDLGRDLRPFRPRDGLKVIRHVDLA